MNDDEAETRAYRDAVREEIKHTTRALYDFQRLRLQSKGREHQFAAGKDVDLEIGDIGFMKRLGDDLEGLEDRATDHLEQLLKRTVVGAWLLNEVRGAGPRMAGVLVSEVDIAKAPYVSSLWKYAGLAVEDGKADSLSKGEKAPYNTFLKSKMLGVLADSFLRTQSPYRAYYDDYKHRKSTEMVDPCMACEGEGEATDEDGDPVTCWNCEGSGGPAPWGRSDAHRHRAALRYMVKEFLKDYYKAARRARGLEVKDPYAEAKLGQDHEDRARDEDRPSTEVEAGEDQVTVA